jgi:RhtB (resistance to homoserine/threonine) family protein
MRGETWTFVGVSIALIVSPGPDIALVTRHALRAGRRAGVITSLGTSTGLAVHGLAAVVGLSAILATSDVAFTVVKFVGAAYLAVLGVRTLWNLRHASRDRDGGETSQANGFAPFRQGVLTNVLNPKVAVFFITFLPQFVGPGESSTFVTLTLAAVFVVMALTWLLIYVALLHSIAGVLQRPRVRRALEGVTGSALVLLGLRLAAAPA